MRERVQWLDVCKGFAILLVVLGHVIDGATMYKNVAWMQYLFKAIYSFHMPFFFFLSGTAFCLSKSKKRESIFNLLLLYVFWSCVGFFFKVAFSSVVTKTVTDNLLVCLLVKPIDPYWYLATLAVYYFVTEVIGIIDYKKVVVALVVISIMSWEVYHSVSFSDPLIARYVYRILYHYLFFYVGIKGIDIIKFFSNRNSTFQLFIHLSFLLLLAIYLVGWLEAAILCAILGTLSIVWDGFCLEQNNREKKLLVVVKQIGKNSLYVYIMHNYITVLFRIIWSRLFSHGIPILYVVLNWVIAVSICMLASNIIRKTRVDVLFNPIKQIKRYKTS